MAAHKHWGQLSRATRQRWAANAQAQFGLSRRSVREMYNRGTYKPGAKTEDKRVPQKVVKQRERSGGLSDAQLRDRIMARFDGDMASRLKYTPKARERKLDTLHHMSSAQLAYMWQAVNDGNDAITDAAHWQAKDKEDGKVPPAIARLFYRNDDGEWVNPFWYH